MNLLQKIFSKPKPAATPRKKKAQVLDEQLFEQLIARKIPYNAVRYVRSLWEEHPFSFEISKSRNSCLGNYRYQHHTHTISVNHDLNPYSFLITLVHEIAHQRVHIAHMSLKRRPDPHGSAWKEEFKRLIFPLLSEDVFPLSILAPLSKHMINPPASSTRDQLLMASLRLFDNKELENEKTLGELTIGSHFVFNKRIFKKLEDRRSRVLCEELQSKKKYTIPKLAEVSLPND